MQLVAIFCERCGEIVAEAEVPDGKPVPPLYRLAGGLTTILYKSYGTGPGGAQCGECMESQNPNKLHPCWWIFAMFGPIPIGDTTNEAYSFTLRKDYVQEGML